MTAMASSTVASADQVKLLKSLVAALQKEDYTKAKQLLQTKDLRLVAAGQQLAILDDCYVKTLLELNDTAALKKELDKKSHSSSVWLQQQEAYIHYRLEQYERVLEALADAEDDGDSNRSRKHLQAQALFHLGRSSEALKVYEELLQQSAATTNQSDESKDDDDATEIVAQLHANALAVLASNATPYCKIENNFETQSFLDKEPDIAVNQGILEAMSSGDMQRLRQVVAQADKSFGDVSEDTAERASFALQSARSYWKGRAAVISGGGNKTLSSEVLQSIQQHNQALALLDLPHQALEQLSSTQSHSKWTPLQTRIARYNKACLQLRAKEYAACRATLKEAAPWFEKASSSTSKQKQQQQNIQLAAAQELTSAQALWWQARVHVLMYYCDEAEAQLAASSVDADAGESTSLNTKESTIGKSLQALQSTLEKLRAMEPSSVVDEAILYIQLHLSEPLTKNNVPVSLQSRPAMQYALGTAEQNGDWYMANGNYVAAVECYQKDLDNQPSAANRAKLVRALSHVDPDQAMRLWESMKNEIAVQSVDSEQANGAELEQQELPRLKSSRMRKTMAAPTLSSDTVASESEQTNKKKSHGAILRRRARQRDAYLEKLAAQGLYRPDRPVLPDPERWLPKYERSYNRKRRNKTQQQQQQHRGAQGGVSDKDSQKLDVVAKQQARANGDVGTTTGKSTAHLSVSGTGGGIKKSGKKK